MLVVFGALFCAADPEFSAWVAHLTNLFSWEIVDPSLRWLIYAVLCSALFLGLTFPKESTPSSEPASGAGEPSTWTIALVMVNALFAGFLAIQAPRLFAVAMPAASQVPRSTVLRDGPCRGPSDTSSTGSERARRITGSFTPRCTSSAPAAT